MANINRDYLIINDVKKSNVSLDNGSITFYITDKNTQNIFVNLVINISDNTLIQKYTNIENAEDYTLTMHIVKPDNTYKIIQGKLHDKANAIFEFDLPDYCCDKVGSYRCELLTKCYINDREEITTSNKITYKVKSSVLNDLDEITEAPEYPLVIQLFDKLSDINQYEEDRRANELARQLAEQQRQTRFNALDADMTNSIQAIDNKVVEVENRITAKEQAVDKLIVDTKADIDEYKVAKDQEIDEYKATKDTEINNAITAQDNKIDTAISEQNNRITVVENNVVAQNTRLDNIEAKNQQQDDRLLDIEKVNKRQDMDLKCLFAESKNNMIDITEEGNSIYLQNSTIGYTLIDEIKGNTLVNCNKEPNKELILNGNINTSGDNAVTITEGVDGGLVDVALEGNTLVNVSKTKDSTAITKAYTVENSGNHIALQGDVDGKCRPVITGNTLWIDNDTEEILTAFDGTKNLRLQSTFEDNLVTQEMVDSREEVADNLGKYKVEYKVTGKNKYKGKLEQGIWDFKNIEKKDNTNICRMTEIFECKPNTKYVLSGSAINSYGGNLAFYDKDMKYLGDKNQIFSFKTFTTPNNAYYFVFHLQKPLVSDVNGTLQIEEGDTATSYEPYKSSIKNLYLNSPLLEGDTIEEKDNGIYHVHRYGKTVLATNLGWVFNEENNYIECKNSTIAHKPDSKLTICDKIPAVFNISTSNIGISTNLRGSSQWRITNKSLSSLDEYMLWLQNNPLTVVYELETPTYELIEQSNLTMSSYTNGHLDFNTAVPVEKVDFLPFEEELTYLYPSTSYTVQFISDKATTADITLGGTSLLAQSIVAGLNRISITTPETLVNNKLVISGVGANISEVVVTDTDREFGYFEGMKSVGESGNLVITSSNSDNSQSNTQQLTHEPLRAVGDVKDRYVMINGKWFIERNIGNLVINKDNLSVYQYWASGADDINTIGFLLDKSILNDTLTRPTSTEIWTTSDIIKSTSYQDAYFKDEESISALGGLYSFSLRVNRSRLIEESINGLKEWLKDNPITVNYIKATPVYEPIDYNPLEVYSRVTHITTNSAIPCNITVKNHGFNCLLKPSTTYTVSSNLGLNTVTTPSVLTEDCLRFMDTDTSSVTTMRDVLVLEGDWTTKADLIPSNFSGIESAFEQEYDTEKGKYKVNVRVANEDKTKENNITFYINEPLRGVGDVKDRVYIKDDKVVVQRNCGSVTLDGSDDETWSNYNYSGWKRVTGFIINCMPKNWITRRCVTNLFNCYTNDLPYDAEGFSNLDNDSRLCIKIDKFKLQTQDVAGFKQWLQQNPLTVIYQLATPTYEEVEYNDTKLFIESFKNSTLFYNSNVPVTSKLYYSYSVPIVDTVAQTANVTDQQDSMIIDLATQVAVMEMMLM